MALNVKPLYPLDHPEVSFPAAKVKKIEPAIENKLDTIGKKPDSLREKPTDLKKFLDIIGHN